MYQLLLDCYTIFTLLNSPLRELEQLSQICVLVLEFLTCIGQGRVRTCIENRMMMKLNERSSTELKRTKCYFNSTPEILKCRR